MWAELLQILSVPKQSSSEPKQYSPTPVQSETEDKGIARTFSTAKAGKREDFTVYEKTFDIKGMELVMVYVPAGEFMMGSNDGCDDEKPVHKVKIEQAFYMGKFPVTVRQFRSFVEATGYLTEAEKGYGAYANDGYSWKKDKKYNWKNPYFKQINSEPVVCISWADGRAYTEWLSKETKQEYHLPTESEWEYACRGGTSTRYWWGDEMENSHCWYWGNADKKTHSVDEEVNEHTNPFGLCDMHGNVWEWCEDDYEGHYNTSRTQIAYKKHNEHSLLRGGAWNNYSDSCRSAYRGLNSNVLNNFGFRVVFPAPRTFHP